jgi:hypothetical protein
MIFRMITIHIDDQGVDPGPPHPSARLPYDASMGDPWMARTLSQFISL